MLECERLAHFMRAGLPCWLRGSPVGGSSSTFCIVVVVCSRTNAVIVPGDRALTPPLRSSASPYLGNVRDCLSNICCVTQRPHSPVACRR